MPEEIQILKNYSFVKNNITGNFPINVENPLLCDFSFFRSLLYSSDGVNDTTPVSTPISNLTDINIPTSFLNLDESCNCENLISIHKGCNFEGGSASIYCDDII